MRFQPGAHWPVSSPRRSLSLEMPHTEETKAEITSFSRGPQGGGFILVVKLIY